MIISNKIILILQAWEESISKKRGWHGSSLRILNPNKQKLHIFTASAVVIEYWNVRIP